jgi:methionyl-tRNA formyltransferase
VRAFAPSPGASCVWQGEALRILLARAEPGPVPDAPGTVRRLPDGGLRIATADGWLVPLRLQRPGGRPLETDAFLRGRPIPDGARLESDPSASLAP